MSIDPVKLETAIESLRPEAKEFVDSLKGQVLTTKNGYGSVMAFLSQFPNQLVQRIFLEAMVREGYDKYTANQIASIMAWS